MSLPDELWDAFWLWRKQESKENANSYPTAVQGFAAGVVAERERIIALLLDNTCPTCEAGDLVHQGCEANLMCVALIKGENE